MKKLKTLITSTLCLCVLCALCAAPASALSYDIGAPGGPEYGKPTSFEPEVTADGGAMKNEDLSKNAALIPPWFGTPTSYLPGSGAYLTPNLAPSQTAGTGAVNGNGPVLTPPSIVTGPDAVQPTPAGFTPVTGDLYYSDGSLGTLKIPSIGLTVKVFEGTDAAPLLKGAGHFEDTSIWNGNIAVAGHNRGVRNDFGKIHTLKAGSIITFTTKLGTRTYAVSGIAKVSMYDVSGLEPTADNQINLYTCVMNQPAYRWRVTALEV